VSFCREVFDTLVGWWFGRNDQSNSGKSVQRVISRYSWNVVELVSGVKLVYDS
jgi:hypothetical protein